MFRRLALSLVVLAAACAQPSGTIPSGERGGRTQVVADFDFIVRQGIISGSYDPQIFDRDRVLGHVRRSCRQGAIVNYDERRSTRRVSFTVQCRQRVLADAIGRWVVERGDGGAEQARKI